MPITTLATVKVRLGIAEATTTYDDLLEFFITQVERRFDQWTGRTLHRAEGLTHQFPGECVAVAPESYPVEAVTKWELKTWEGSGWVEKDAPEHLIKECGVIVWLASPLGACGEIGRITYNGGYVFPGEQVGAGQTSLPAWLADAAVEQVAQLYQLRESLGVSRVENNSGLVWSMAEYVWVPWVRVALTKLRRSQYLGHL